MKVKVYDGPHKGTILDVRDPPPTSVRLYEKENIRQTPRQSLSSTDSRIRVYYLALWRDAHGVETPYYKQD